MLESKLIQMGDWTEMKTYEFSVRRLKSIATEAEELIAGNAKSDKRWLQAQLQLQDNGVNGVEWILYVPANDNGQTLLWQEVFSSAR